MKYFTVFFLLLFSFTALAQEKPVVQKVSGTIINDNSLLPIPNVNVINVNKVKGVVTNPSGYFEMEVSVSDTLHISILGYQSLRVRVTNDWLKNGTAKIQLTEKAIALEEVIVKKYDLTGYLEVDSKLIPEKENYRYSISGLPQAYEAGESSPNAFTRVLGSIFNPADMLYNFFGNKPKELRKLKQMKKDDTVRNLLESKFDREMISVLLGVDKKEIAEILQRCNYSESFIQTANDLQILDAISACYEEYKVLSKKHEKYIKD
ncbi:MULTISPECIES: carboxypeptidase-like regulatory domain-containing protein [Flavobacterium]|uniref:Carboxypeptidase-like regulatory domain-containing protein n=1 Tax=Flavobacterium sedimenticola TaxID=3043286 RepID=A0ABT6XPF5_9FLAO|nr:carboxypeptidase-like regulatory domain-containing protein [Flavobacterium sedimenticola]MDI9256975.1 carboxypeptidase-like regulatory domain-containing protein [Flavobacterium sedimenticola]